MRGSHEQLCGCFPTGRHYPGIADRIAKVVEAVEGLAEGFDATAEWARMPFAVIDFETTGRDPNEDRIVEIGVVCFDEGEVSSRRSLLVHPTIPIKPDASAVHGISDEDVADAPRFDQLLPDLVQLLTDRLPVAYNADFDRSFLHTELRRAASAAPSAEALPPAMREQVKWIDPLVWAREILHELDSRALGDVCQHLGIPLEGAHRAAHDSEATGRVLLSLSEHMPRSYGELVRLQGRYAARQEAEIAAKRNRRPSPS